MADGTAATIRRWLPLMRCVECGGELHERFEAGSLDCEMCGRKYPVIDGTVRMETPRSGSEDDAEVRRRTASSFSYEWERFGGPREEWRRNFAGYMHPHGAEFFRGIRVLDAGAGSGRHSRQAADAGAEVAALDGGGAIDVARRNVQPEVLTVQADIERLPFEDESFDFVMSIGVLHHLPDAGRGLARLVRSARPGGRVRLYLYWVPERAWHRTVLRGVTAARKVTVRLPHRLLHALCYPLAAALYATIVVPYRLLRRIPFTRRFAEALPLKAYADYPFGVLVNDQFDRFSAPVEHRFTRAEVEGLMHDAGLVDVLVMPHHGWIAEGTRPVGTDR